MTQPARLSETQRRHYLDAMGVQAWYPRVRLPSAPDPVVFDLDDTPPADTAAPSSADAGASVSTPVAEPEAGEPAPPTPPPVGHQPAASPDPRRTVQSAPVPRFALSLSVVGGYLVADSLAKGMEQPSQAGQMLLFNILARLGVDAQPVQVHHVIQWPLFTNPKVDQSLAQACVYVDEKLDQFIRQHQPQRLLSFGAVMPRLQGWEQPETDYNGLPSVGLPSLYRMLSDPRQKAVAWHRLRPWARG